MRHIIIGTKILEFSHAEIAVLLSRRAIYLSTFEYGGLPVYKLREDHCFSAEDVRMFVGGLTKD